MDSFILKLIIAIIVNVAFLKVLYVSTREGEILDTLLGWGKLERKYGMIPNPTFKQDLIYRILGGCQFCFSWWWSLVCFLIFAAIVHFGMGAWFVVENDVWQWVLNIVCLIGYNSVATTLTTLVISR
jgi:hypothetical protein